MSGLDTIAVALQFVVPLALIVWLAAPRRRGWPVWLLDVVLAAGYLGLIGLAGLWLVLPQNLLWILAAVTVGAAAFGSRRLDGPTAHGTPLGMRAGVATRVVAVLIVGGLVAYAIAGRQPPVTPAMDLRFPLEGGTYLVVSGGSNRLVNFHVGTLEGEQARPYRGQSYAVDLVELGGWGSRSAQITPDDPAGFAIFGAPIRAPCPGVVVHAEDGHPDRLTRGQPPATLAGNHVILDCADTWIVMAHMQQGSVRVRPTESVRGGDVLGRVGNSGSSGEPHLHIHAQTPGSADARLGGSPLPITLDGRYLARNDPVRGTWELGGGSPP